MLRIIPFLWLAFKVWMLVDAYKRGVQQFWYYIIFFIPLGAVAYFFMIKSRDANFKKLFEKPLTIDDLRYKLKTTPSLENQLLLAEALYDKNEFHEALQIYQQALQQQPNNHDALFGQGSCQFKLGQLSQSIAPLSALISRHSAYRDYAAWPLLAQAHWELNQKEDCLNLLRRLNKTNPRMDHELLLAKCLINMEIKMEAKNLIQNSLEHYAHSAKYIKRKYRREADEMKQLHKQITS